MIVIILNLGKLVLLGEGHLVLISGPAGISFSCLTCRFHFKLIDAIVVAALERFSGAVGAAERPPRATTPVCRLWARPSDQVLYPNHHLSGNRQHLILHTRIWEWTKNDSLLPPSGHPLQPHPQESLMVRFLSAALDFQCPAFCLSSSRTTTYF